MSTISETNTVISTTTSKIIRNDSHSNNNNNTIKRIEIENMGRVKHVSLLISIYSIEKLLAE